MSDEISRLQDMADAFSLAVHAGNRVADHLVTMNDSWVNGAQDEYAYRLACSAGRNGNLALDYLDALIAVECQTLRKTHVEELEALLEHNLEVLRQYAEKNVADMTALCGENERLKAEIADAREACPSVRMQDHFDAPLLTLINNEVRRGFNRDAELHRICAELTDVRGERDKLKAQLETKAENAD